MRRWFIAAAFLLLAVPAQAQSDFMLRGFADAGSMAFAAKQSFEAVLGSRHAPVLGGGVEVVLPQRIFLSLRASRVRRSGERVFVSGGQQFNLGIPTTITVIPLVAIAGYRFERGWRVVPYAGGGIGWHRYQETSDFSGPGENVDERHLGYHLVGGAELRLTGWIAAAAEAEWGRVPDALGWSPNSVSSEFGESDLGGTALRVKLVIGC